MTAAPVTRRFAFGAVLYDSADFVPTGAKLVAATLSSLWS
ncbi:hypothetical protein ACVIHI_008708 [Bradyrhizobium sp. USDA 4524]|nr:hypothetical protein [Bradyrhizobium sp. USDA 4538]MCP1906850.1 hypothetical protein [Bradyrhizobium sp. USDA 4537]MCP1985325.1 hypothetical protein [Bradyrhizobium sp. USDA 4539]